MLRVHKDGLGMQDRFVDESFEAKVVEELEAEAVMRILGIQAAVVATADAVVAAVDDRNAGDEHAKPTLQAQIHWLTKLVAAPRTSDVKAML